MAGYQFEFFCDRCGNRFKPEFKASAMGMAGKPIGRYAAGRGRIGGRRVGRSVRGRRRRFPLLETSAAA